MSLPLGAASLSVSQASDAVRDAWRHCKPAITSAVLLSLVINVLMLASPLFMLRGETVEGRDTYSQFNRASKRGI